MCLFLRTPLPRHGQTSLRFKVQNIKLLLVGTAAGNKQPSKQELQTALERGCVIHCRSGQYDQGSRYCILMDCSARRGREALVSAFGIEFQCPSMLLLARVSGGMNSFVLQT